MLSRPGLTVAEFEGGKSEENQELKSIRENPMKEFEVRWPEE